MKRHIGIRGAIAGMLALLLAAGAALPCAAAEDWPAETVSDEAGRIYKQVKKQDGGVEVWQFIGVFGSPEEALELAKTAERAFVIGGGSVYRQMLQYCDTAYITKVHCRPDSDTYFPNLDADSHWELTEVLQSGEENGISYEMCLYRRKHL